MTDQDLINRLRNSRGWPTLGNAAADHIEALIRERDDLTAALADVEAERHRWRQAAAKGSIHTQADLDRAVNEARAVALQEAAEWHKEVIAHDQGGLDYASAVGIPISNDDDLRASVAIHEYALNRILAMIDTPAAEALERVRAEAYLSGWVNGSNGVEPPDFGNPVFEKTPGD